MPLFLWYQIIIKVNKNIMFPITPQLADGITVHVSIFNMGPFYQKKNFSITFCRNPLQIQMTVYFQNMAHLTIFIGYYIHFQAWNNKKKLINMSFSCRSSLLFGTKVDHVKNYKVRNELCRIIIHVLVLITASKFKFELTK